MKINKAELQRALEKVKPGLANRELVEQSTSFAFVRDRVITYNDEISISHPVTGLEVCGAVKAQALYEFLNKIRREEIDVEWEENQVVIRAGRAKAGLVFEQEVRLPVEEMGKIGKWKKLPEDFLAALKFCYPCCDRDMGRPALTCVYVRGKIIEASDSYQIVQYFLSEEIPTERFLIPASAVRDLVKYNVKEIAEGEGWIHFRTEEGTVFSSRILLGNFPETARHMDMEGGVEFTFPQNMDQILERALIFSKKDIRMGDVPVVTVEIKNLTVTASAQNESGWFEEVARAKYKGAPIRFSVGIEFLKNVLSKLQRCVICENKIGFTGENWAHVVALISGGEE